MDKYKRVYIEISNICNLQCSFCPEVERKKSIMGLQLFESTLAQVAPLTEQVCLHLMGEPLTHPHFEEILQICQKHSVKINLTTNGVLLERHAEKLLHSTALHQINFSIHSFKDNFKDKSIEPYMRSILNFSLKAHEINPALYINYRLWNISDSNRQNESNSDLLELIGGFFGVAINPSIDVGSIKSKRIWNKVYLHFDSRFEWPHLAMPVQSHTGFCHALSSHIGIHADGSVVPCCLDKEALIKLGNCHTEPLEQIINSDRAQAMRAGFNQKKLAEELCKRCTYIKRFR